MIDIRLLRGLASNSSSRMRVFLSTLYAAQQSMQPSNPQTTLYLINLSI